ncbi:MAG: alpha/beta fold hydrolase [Acidimicrobiaceae bacterium]|nr:alpha/beta fold hydrolase [Acidimicrobiaceae bacterium]MXZ67090.1 alpha/beta fold hydrolase [Acidimicrobiaceae bacterium]MYF35100.1 alpha/beta fold hydrolase [Acidimicrobiaceae bacterium]MYG78100.1 alpha/beta fold hydrolase [Acidimicrobiaceae bacterium]MYJ28533.1 alpha/beta fold hydrolase [Acidimicrobiaceae bacterium]
MIQYPLGAAGTLTRVLEAGRGDKNMLLVHGVGARADRWRLNLERFADAGYHPYAIDLPGHGLAEKGDRFDHSVPNYAAFARAVLDQIGSDRVYLVGTSLGGHILATVACEIPERVAGLVLVGTLGMAPIGPEARERTAGLIGDTSPEMVDRKLHSVLHDDSLVTAALHREEVRINNSPGAAESFERISDYFANRIDDHVVGERLAAMGGRMPILLVWGRQDLGFPLAMGEAAHELLAGSRLAIMDDAAHAPYFERPDTFNAIVIQFFAGRLGEEPLDGVELRG